jgi:adenylyltransferase/sulfurtransferase
VLGGVTGTIGTIQATEALKLLMDVGDRLTGRLLVYDAKDLTTEYVPITATPDCPVCGADPIDSLGQFSYEGTCSLAD